MNILDFKKNEKPEKWKNNNLKNTKYQNVN